ncbi:MAG: hypothetical protein IKX78_04000 [Clostridia bacterium]|nr:hypothetical protein [Clostridia bacterium]
MTPRERFCKVLRFEKPDRLPLIEWAAWWDKTFNRWKTEGLDPSFDTDRSLEYFGLEKLYCFGASPQIPHFEHEGNPVRDERDYDELVKNGLYSDAPIENLVNTAKRFKEAHDNGDFSVRIWLDGFFWYPRRLFGIEEHFYSFYDYPELLKRINSDLADFNVRAIQALYTVDTPDFVGLAEDMSYNHGPMLSKELFDEFLAPYYRRVIPEIKKKDVPVLVDSDGDITTMIPWLLSVGIQGVYPLEKQAGVDICKIREMYPEFLMMGGYDKMVMSKTEEDMRKEFERILPVMKSGGYIPSVDHQTPPEVSLENYNIYVRLVKEYVEK